MQGITVFKNADQPEKFTWSRVVSMITRGPRYSDSAKIGMITDHDLGNHAKYMAREIPIYRDTYLPPTITLIYSSTDGGREEITNFLLSLAHKTADDVLRQLDKTGTATFVGQTISLDRIQDVLAE